MLRYINGSEKNVPTNLRRGDEADMKDVLGLAVGIFVFYSMSVIYLC
jgi:hypothetical protein